MLTLSSPVVRNGYTSKCSGPYWSNPPFLNFWHSGALVLSPERQSARMSTNYKGWVRPVWRWTLWYKLIFATIRKSVRLQGLILTIYNSSKPPAERYDYKSSSVVKVSQVPSLPPLGASFFSAHLDPIRGFERALAVISPMDSPATNEFAVLRIWPILSLKLDFYNGFVEQVA